MAGKKQTSSEIKTSIAYTPEDLLDHRAIGAIITNEKKEILIQEHIKYGFWTIPIGKVHQSQTVEEGLARELFEECNIVIKEWKKIAARDYYYNRNGKKVVVFAHLFHILKYSGKIKNKEPNKHKKQKFMTIEQIKQLPKVSDLMLLYLESTGFTREKSL